MTTTVTMLQTRLGENGSLWTVGNSYAASDAFAAVLISSNLATGTLPKSRSLVPLWGQTDTTGAVASLVDGAGNPVSVGGDGSGDALVANPLSQFAATTSAQLRGVISDETGTGALVFATSPTLVTPALGTPSSVVLTNATGIPAGQIVGVVPVANLGTGTPNGSKFLRDDGSFQAIPGGGDALVANPLSQFAATTSLQLKGVISDETGSGSLVFATSPTLVTPVLGVASATSLNKVAITAPATGATLVVPDGVTATMPSTSGTVAKAVQTEAGFSFAIDAPADQDYTIILRAPHAGTITETSSKCTSGTCTATFKIGGVALGGAANAVSSTQVNTARSTFNAFAAGDAISVTISANSTCVGAAFSVKYTRTLA